MKQLYDLIIDVKSIIFTILYIVIDISFLTIQFLKFNLHAIILPKNPHRNYNFIVISFFFPSNFFPFFFSLNQNLYSDLSSLIKQLLFKNRY